MMRQFLRLSACISLLISSSLVFDTSAVAQWNPFGEDRGASSSRPRTSARRDKVPPPISQSVLLSRATYDAMGQAVARYDQIVRSGGWRAIPSGPTLRFGARDERVVLLRRRLKATGELHPGAQESSGYGREVSDAVKRFQERHGLTPSGNVNRFTLRALNVSAQKRLHQLRLNRKRLNRLITKTQGRTYIVVNIPGYELQAVSRGQLQISSRVVVGKPVTSTPEVSAHVRAVNFLPYWHVPQSIAHRALIPAVKKDPNYLRKEHIRVFASWGGAEVDSTQVNWWAPQGKRYVFRQDPGPFNALGLIRLDMSNKYIVYMHDTPLKKLFRYHLRPYSAGCVRVEQVQPLASWLLQREAGWGSGRVAQAIQSGQQQTVKLKRPIPVHFVYLSAWVSGDGQIKFRMDIYDKDGSGASGARTAKWETGSRSVAP